MQGVVVLSFDFDAESPWLAPGVEDAHRDLTQLSWGAFGARRGIRRIVDFLGELTIPATFFVPGWTVDAYPDRVRQIHGQGHEIAHHGYHHVPSVGLSSSAQRDDLVRGIDAIERCVGTRPVGYRSPAWQLTPVTFELLLEFDFLYDSSCMGDDRPYIECSGDLELLELPVHWTLDDYPHLGWRPQHSGPLRDPSELMATWRREVEVAIREARPIILTCHPEVIGRGGPMDAFADLIRSLQADPRVRFARCVDLAQDMASASPGRMATPAGE